MSNGPRLRKLPAPPTYSCFNDVIAFNKSPIFALGKTPEEVKATMIRLMGSYEAKCATGLVDVVLGGPKVFRPTEMECEAASAVSMNFPTEEYQQPFKVFVVEPNSAWNIKARGDCEDSLVGLIVAHKNQTDMPDLVVTMYFSRGGTLSLGIVPTEGETLQSSLDRCLSRPFDELEETKIGPVLEKNRDYVYKTATMAINCCFLLAHFGAVDKGSTNPAKAAELKKRIKKNSKHNAHVEREMTAIPRVYGFDQNVILYERSRKGERGDGSGPKMGPHFRRGHMRNQPCGPGLTEVRRIFIKPVYVNWDLFVGSPSDTSVTYTSKES